MATAWQVILREVGKRVNAFVSTAVPATANTDYTTSPLTTTQIVSIVRNLGLIQDTALDVHGRIALTIADVRDPVTGIGSHPWRSFFAGVTGSVASGSNLPTTTGTPSGKTIIGALGRPYRATAATQYLQPASVERVSRYLANTSLYTNNPWIYHIDGAKVLHSTDNIVFNVCYYDRADQATTLAANGNIILPDALVDTLVAGTVASFMVENDLIEQAQGYGMIYKAGLDAIASGSIAMPGLPNLIGAAA